jgi:hypothetical protein
VRAQGEEVSLVFTPRVIVDFNASRKRGHNAYHVIVTHGFILLLCLETTPTLTLI